MAAGLRIDPQRETSEHDVDRSRQIGPSASLGVLERQSPKNAVSRCGDECVKGEGGREAGVLQGQLTSAGAFFEYGLDHANGDIY